MRRNTFQWKQRGFQWKQVRHSVNEGFGKDFHRHRKGNSVKRSGRFSEPPDSDSFSKPAPAPNLALSLVSLPESSFFQGELPQEHSIWSTPKISLSALGSTFRSTSKISLSALGSTFRSTPISHSTLGSTFQSTSGDFTFSTPVAGRPDGKCRPLGLCDSSGREADKLLLCPLSKKLVWMFFFEFAWEFCIEKWRGFSVSSFWSPFPTKQLTKNPLKNSGKIQSKVRGKIRDENSKVSGSFCSAAFLT